MNDQKKLIESLHNRLGELIETEIDDSTQKEIESILGQLEELEPLEYDREYHSPAKAFERFKEKHGQLLK